LLNRSSGIFSNFGAEKPPLRQAAGRYKQANRRKQPKSKIKQ